VSLAKDSFVSARLILQTFLSFAVLLIPLLTRAHDSPEHVIEALTARIESTGADPELLWERATEYRALGNLDAAAADLKRALKARADFVIAMQDLARLELVKGNSKEALRIVNRALRVHSDDAGKAPSRMLRAEILCARGAFKEALPECELALQHATGTELDWYLTRADIQRRLGQFEQAAAGLKQAYEQTGSAVLEAEWIDAMIDAGQFAPALERVEARLTEVRCRSSWLLRRARLRLAQGATDAAHQDLHAAITEMNERLTGLTPEPALLADRCLAYALLGDAVLARRDLQTARKLGADAILLRRAETALAERG
jgi:tetratricopeptide (TPR) repeat protein